MFVDCPGKAESFLVPTLCVGTEGFDAPRRSGYFRAAGYCVPTQSMGTRN